MPSTNRIAFMLQQTTEHPAARERVFQMQLIDPTHQRQIRGRHLLRRVVYRRARQPKTLALLRHRQLVSAVDHRFALSSPALVSALSKKLARRLSPPVGIETAGR